MYLIGENFENTNFWASDEYFPRRIIFPDEYLNFEFEFFQKIVPENRGIKFKCDKKWVLDAMEAKLAEEETQEVQEGYFDENMEICS